MLHGINNFQTLGLPGAPRPEGPSSRRDTTALTFSGADSLERSRRIGPDYEPRVGKTLYAPGTPFFLLHGTFNSGQSLAPMVDWLRHETGRNTHPLYVSYLPEIEHGTGIQNDSDGHPAAYKMALRDMGDFTFQLVHLRLKELNAQLEQAEGDSSQAIGNFFGVRPSERDWLVPLIQRHLIEPALRQPVGLSGEKQSLEQLADYGVGKVRQEFEKLAPRKRDREQPIIGTEKLRELAQNQGWELNTDPNKLYPDKINLRSIRFRDIARMEASLTALSGGLKQAIQDTLAEREPSLSAEQRDARARSITDLLMQKIAPRGMALGHSQGGTALLYAALKTIENEQKAESSGNPDAKFQRIEAAGRFIGSAQLFNAPVMGMKREHAIGEVVRDELQKAESWVPFLERRSDPIYQRVNDMTWSAREKKHPAIAEMQAGSALMTDIQRLLPRLQAYAQQTGFSLASVWDRGDKFVENEASDLKLRRPGQPDQSIPGVLNIELQGSQLNSRYRSADDMLQKAGQVYGKMAGWLTMRLPAHLKDYVYTIYTERLLGLEQHRALIMLPEYVFKALGRKMLDEPSPQGKSNLEQVLAPTMFEPFRGESFKARHRMLRAWQADSPTRQAANLGLMFRDFPGLLPALLNAAAERSPLEQSASWQAGLMLDDLLTMLESVAQRPSLRQRYKGMLTQTLQTIAEAALDVAPSPEKPTLSARAEALLEAF